MHRAIFARWWDVSRTYPFQPDWRGEYARYDTMFIEVDAELDGMLGMTIGRALLFFSFKFRGRKYSCALVHWLTPLDQPDEDTGCG